MNEKETWWFNFFVSILSRERVYNLAHTGNAHNTSEETCNKIRIKALGRKSKYKGIPRSNIVKLKLRIANLGKKASEETKKKMSNSHKGKINSGMFYKGMKAWNKGIHHTEKENELNRIAHSKKVILDNKYIFNSMLDCAKYLGVSISMVSSHIMKGTDIKKHLIRLY